MSHQTSPAMIALERAREQLLKAKTNRQIINAFEGFYVLQVQTDDKDFPIGAIKEPVIGWEIEDGSNQPIPLTPSGCDFDPLDILYPDGQVCNPFSCSYESVEAWLKDLQSEYHAKHKRKG